MSAVWIGALRSGGGRNPGSACIDSSVRQTIGDAWGGVHDERYGRDLSVNAVGTGHDRQGERKVIDAEPAILRAVVFGDRTFESAPIELSGDRRLAKAFFRLFSRPASGV